MSVKISTLVWQLELPRGHRLVLLAYADHASHDGTNVFPSVALIARKTGYSERSVQRITRRLVSQGLLRPDGGQTGGRKITARWRIPLADDRIASLGSEKGDKTGAERVTPAAQKGDNSSLERVTPVTQKGDTAMSPESSLTVRGTVRNPEDDDDDTIHKRIAHLTTLYEHNIGPITPLMADMLRNAAAEFPEAWYPQAFGVAVRNNARRWQYVHTVLDGWKRNGFGWKPERPGSAANHSQPARRARPAPQSAHDADCRCVYCKLARYRQELREAQEQDE